MKTTPLAAVAQPKSGWGSARFQSRAPSLASSATNSPCRRIGSSAPTAWYPVALPCVQRSTTGTKSARRRRPSATRRRRRSRGRSWTVRAGSGPVVVQVPSDGGLPDAPVCRLVPGDDDAGLAGPDDDVSLRAARGIVREDRRELEVVVADIVGRDLVVPEQLPRPAVEDEQRVGVERRAREGAAVRLRRACRRSDRGSRRRSRGFPAASSDGRVPAPPPPATAGWRQGRGSSRTSSGQRRCGRRARRWRRGRRAGSRPC